jgi:hypothetical protein
MGKLRLEGGEEEAVKRVTLKDLEDGEIFKFVSEDVSDPEEYYIKLPKEHHRYHQFMSLSEYYVYGCEISFDDDVVVRVSNKTFRC